MYVLLCIVNQFHKYFYFYHLYYILLFARKDFGH